MTEICTNLSPAFRKIGQEREKKFAILIDFTFDTDGVHLQNLTFKNFGKFNFM